MAKTKMARHWITIERDGDPATVDTYPVDTDEQSAAAREALRAAGLASARVGAGDPECPDSLLTDLVFFAGWIVGDRVQGGETPEDHDTGRVRAHRGKVPRDGEKTMATTTMTKKMTPTTRTIETMVCEALAGRRRARADLASAIWEACGASELPDGARLGSSLRITTDDVPCSQSGCAGAGWPERGGEARTLTWDGEVILRDDASWFDGSNLQRQYTALATSEHPRAARIAALRACADALPGLVAAYLEGLASETLVAQSATATLREAAGTAR